MINTEGLLEAIASKLKSHYPLATVYPEPVEQGLDIPSFMIVLDDASQSPKLAGAQQRDVAFDVHYFPQGSSLECYAVQDKLLKELQTVTSPAGNTVHVRRLRGQVVDNVLHIQGSVRLHFYRDAPDGLMDGIATESEVSYG